MSKLPDTLGTDTGGAPFERVCKTADLVGMAGAHGRREICDLVGSALPKNLDHLDEQIAVAVEHRQRCVFVKDLDRSKIGQQGLLISITLTPSRYRQKDDSNEL